MARRYIIEHDITDKQFTGSMEDPTFISMEYPSTDIVTSHEMNTEFDTFRFFSETTAPDNYSSFTDNGHISNLGRYYPNSRLSAERSPQNTVNTLSDRIGTDKITGPRVGVNDEAIIIKRNGIHSASHVHYNTAGAPHDSRMTRLHTNSKKAITKLEGVTPANNIAMQPIPSERYSRNMSSYNGTAHSIRVGDTSLQSATSNDTRRIKHDDREIVPSENSSYTDQIDDYVPTNDIIMYAREILIGLISEIRDLSSESEQTNLLNVLKTAILLLKSCDSNEPFQTNLRGVGGPHYAAPTMLAHPDEFKNPSSFLKIYGDPSCGYGQNSGSSVGPIKNQSGNWACSMCLNINFPRRFRCNKCNEIRDSTGDQIVLNYAKAVFLRHRKQYQHQLFQNVIPSYRAQKTNNQVSSQHKFNYTK